VRLTAFYDGLEAHEAISPASRAWGFLAHLWECKALPPTINAISKRVCTITY